jgi:hypothetical protein
MINKNRSALDRKWLLDDALYNQTRTKALDAYANSLGRFASLHPQRLQVRTEPALRNTGGLTAVTTQVFRLTAFNLLVTANRLLVTNRAFGTHDNLKSRSKSL